MAYSGSFTKSSLVTTQSITGLGFQASCIIFFSAGNTSSATWQGDVKQMAGFWSPFGGGYSVCASTKDGAGTTQTARYFATNPICFVKTSHALESEASLTVDPDGFTLNWITNTASTDYVVNYIAFTSTEAPLSQTINWTMPTSGDAVVTGLTWQPNLVFHLHAGAITATLPAGDHGAAYGFGAMGPNATDSVGATETGQWFQSLFSSDSSGTSASFSKFSSPSGASASKGCMLGLSGIGADTLRATFQSFDGGGFTLNFPTHPSGNYQAASLCLQVTDAWVGSFTKTTAAAPVTQTVKSGLSFDPGCALYATTSKTSGAGTGGLRASLAARDTATSSVSIAVQDENGAGTSNAHSYSSDYLNIANNDTQTITAVGVPQFPGSGALSVNWTTNDGNGTVIGFVAMPSVSVPPVPGTAWLVINEPIGGLTDQTARLDFSGDSGGFQLMMRQRGTADIPIRVAAGDSYSPTIGSEVFLYDVGPTATTLVFVGTIDTIPLTWDGVAGYRTYHCTAVSLEQCLDAILVPPQAFLNVTAGYIVTTLFNTLMTGSPISLGTISGGATIPSLVISDYTPLSDIISNLATSSQFVWYVDPATQQLEFHVPSLTSAPFTLATEDILWDSFRWEQNRQDFRDRQVIQLSQNAFANSSELFAPSGSANFTLRELPNQVVAAWVTKNTQNTATGTFTGLPSDGDTVTISYPASGSTYNWAALSPYTVGQIIIDPAGHVQKVTTGGTSGAAQPTWNASGSTTVDGTVIWTDQGISGGGSFADTVYTFKTAIDNTQWGQVLIGATAAACATNLVYALNASESHRGVEYSMPTWENPLLNADAPAAGTFTVRNKSAGAGYIAALSESATNFSWSASLTSGGSTTLGTETLQVAVEGTSNTANLYYTPGSASVELASVPGGPSLPITAPWYLQVEYTRLGGDCIVVEDTALVQARAAIEQGTGKYQQKITDTQNTSAPTGLLAAQEALTAYSTLPVSFSFDTYFPGLTPGQYLTIGMSDRPVGIAALVNGDYVVQEVRGKLVEVDTYLDPDGMPTGANAGHYRYTVTVINVGVIGSYLDFWAGLGGSGGGSSAGPVVAGASPAGTSTATTVTSVALAAPTQFAVSGSPITTAGTLTLAWNTQTANTVLAGPTSGAAAVPTFRALVAADISFSFVTSVAFTAPASEFSVAGSPITSAGTINLTWKTQTARTVLIGPNGGAAAVPTFRALVAADIPSLSSTYLTVANNLSDVPSPSTARANLGLGTGDAPQFYAVTSSLGNWNLDYAGNLGLNGDLTCALVSGSGFAIYAGGTGVFSGGSTTISAITIEGGIITAYTP